MATPLAMSFDFFARSEASTEFYSVVAQVIAAMYLAVALESFVGAGVVLDRLDRIEFGTLLTVSWLGMIACMRGIVTPGDEPWTAGLGGMGMLAAAFLVTSNLANRASLRNPSLVIAVGYIACLAPIPIFAAP